MLDGPGFRVVVSLRAPLGGAETECEVKGSSFVSKAASAFFDMLAVSALSFCSRGSFLSVGCVDAAAVVVEGCRVDRDEPALLNEKKLELKFRDQPPRTA